MKNYLKLLWYKRKLLFMRRHPNFCFWLPRTTQMIYFSVTQATHSAANHRLALSNLFSRHCPGAWAPHALMRQTRPRQRQCGSSYVVLMHALKVAVLLECQVLFDCVFCISLVCFEDFSGQTDIRPGGGTSPLPFFLLGSTGSWFSNVPTYFHKHIKFIVLSCSTTESVVTAVVVFFVECLYFLLFKMFKILAGFISETVASVDFGLIYLQAWRNKLVNGFKIRCRYVSISAFFEFLRNSNEDFYTLALSVRNIDGEDYVQYFFCKLNIFLLYNTGFNCYM